MKNFDQIPVSELPDVDLKLAIYVGDLRVREGQPYTGNKLVWLHRLKEELAHREAARRLAC